MAKSSRAAGNREAKISTFGFRFLFYVGRPSSPVPAGDRAFEDHGGRSSMVELQIVILAVAGSSPVGHPFLCFYLHQSGQHSLAFPEIP